jgi:hypothetical protein
VPGTFLARVMYRRAGPKLSFEEAFGTLESRIRKFLVLPLGRLTDRALSRELALIGDEP